MMSREICFYVNRKHCIEYERQTMIKQKQYQYSLPDQLSKQTSSMMNAPISNPTSHFWSWTHLGSSSQDQDTVTMAVTFYTLTALAVSVLTHDLIKIFFNPSPIFYIGFFWGASNFSVVYLLETRQGRPRFNKNEEEEKIASTD